MSAFTPRRRHRAAVSGSALLAATALVAGCGTTTEATDTTSVSFSPAPRTPTPAATHAVHGLDGTWRPINSDSPIASLTISGTAVTTTGTLACPGTLAQTTTETPVLTLHCTTPDSDRARGTLKLKPDGSALVINWDGPQWGGALDSLRRV
ncbi:hypothetical protein OG252_45310 [Streptomyces sp. NBC_01352]|uniref:hypothetical protein n=1 Tax=Streptomyces sp. NBC_01352 TaxID=2903834 RepID=UPI002E2EEBCC|nr:hypothetical protein [Streptomyces sp. NBC_01352]